MKNIILILGLFLALTGQAYSQINSDTVSSDIPGGGSGGGGLSQSDIDTPAKLNAFVTPDLADISSSQTFTNKLIDCNGNTCKPLRADDCTTFTAATGGQYCVDTDDLIIYFCDVAIDAVCDDPGEWVAISSATSMDALTDTTITSAQDGDILHYDTGAWVNVAFSSLNASTASALASNPTDCSSNQFANAIAANGNLTCSAIADADVPNTITIDLASAATALASNPTDCSAGEYATTIAASGNLTCAVVDAAEVTNTPSGDIGATDVQGAINELDGEKVSLNGDLMQGILTLHSQGLTIADSGDGNPASDTTAPTGNDVYVTCNDTDGCNYTPSETGAVNNRAVTVRNTSANTLNMVPSAGVLVTCDTATYSLSQGQSTRIKYVTDTWYEVCESTDWADLRNVPAFRKTLFQLRPQANEPPASSFATLFQRNSHPGLSFDGDVCAIWSFVMPNTYGGNGVTAEIWIVSSETSNDTDWDGSWERIETSQDIDSDSFATAISADNNNNNATSGIPTKVSIAFTNGAQMDSCAAGELCRFRLCRDATSDTGGTTNGQAVMIGGELKETP